MNLESRSVRFGIWGSGPVTSHSESSSSKATLGYQDGIKTAVTQFVIKLGLFGDYMYSV